MSFKKSIQKVLNETAAKTMGLDLYGYVKISLPKTPDDMTQQEMVDDIIEVTNTHWKEAVGEPTRSTCGIEHYHSKLSEGNIGEDCVPHIHIHYHWDTNKNPIDFVVLGEWMRGVKEGKKKMSNMRNTFMSKLKIKRPQYDWSFMGAAISIKWESYDTCAIDCMKYAVKQYGHEKNQKLCNISDRYHTGYTDMEFTILREAAVDYWQTNLALWKKKKKTCGGNQT